MIKIEANWIDLRYLDDLSTQKTFIHSLHPGVKLLTTLFFVVAVTSFPKYEFAALLPFFFYPLAQISLGNLPWQHLLKRLLLVAPFVLFVGVFNPLLDRTPVAILGPLVLSGGWLSFFSITLRLSLTVTAALILVATTGVDGVCSGLLRLGVPRVLVVQILFMYRYLHVLLEELIRCIQAYTLRSFHGESLRFQAWGSLLGQLLLRTLDRAQRIYQAMLCRGFDGEVPFSRKRTVQSRDVMYLFSWTAFFVLARCVNIPQWLGNLLAGVAR
ncbi:MAG TPA: cobalt ECF transporter T component CbiQ [Patescibacteria group bacterium]|nr:cobalt ECF transporter T component CbiQ [Patescibacteria group bacterium]